MRKEPGNLIIKIIDQIKQKYQDFRKWIEKDPKRKEFSVYVFFFFGYFLFGICSDFDELLFNPNKYISIRLLWCSTGVLVFFLLIKFNIWKKAFLLVAIIGLVSFFITQALEQISFGWTKIFSEDYDHIVYDQIRSGVWMIDRYTNKITYIVESNGSSLIESYQIPSGEYIDELYVGNLIWVVNNEDEV